MGRAGVDHSHGDPALQPDLMNIRQAPDKYPGQKKNKNYKGQDTSGGVPVLAGTRAGQLRPTRAHTPRDNPEHYFCVNPPRAKCAQIRLKIACKFSRTLASNSLANSADLFSPRVRFVLDIL